MKKIFLIICILAFSAFIFAQSGNQVGSVTPGRMIFKTCNKDRLIQGLKDAKVWMPTYWEELSGDSNTVSIVGVDLGFRIEKSASGTIYFNSEPYHIPIDPDSPEGLRIQAKKLLDKASELEDAARQKEKEMVAVKEFNQIYEQCVAK